MHLILFLLKILSLKDFFKNHIGNTNRDEKKILL